MLFVKLDFIMLQRILKKYLVRIADISYVNPNWWSQIPFYLRASADLLCAIT